MPNPLGQFLAVEDREDGVYVKVSASEKSSIGVGDLVRALESAGVINFSEAKLADVIQNARGVYEKIGPPFEYYNPSLENYVTVSITAQSASAKIDSKCISQGIVPNERALAMCLQKKGIRYGLKNDVLRQIAVNTKYDTLVEVAKAKDPVKGDDARADLQIDLNPESKPQVKSDGNVDYRNIQTFISVNQGQVIAKKIPATKGTDGIAVNGESIKAVPGADIKLPQGKNTELTDNGNNLIALKTGIVYFENNLIHIAELLTINKNIDYSVGNIKYTGDVLINGNVLPGFIVEAEGNIHIRGDVESARIISRNGNVLIDRGVIGKGDTMISGKAGVELAFAQEATITTDGPLMVHKFLLHCECHCLSLEIRDSQGSVIGGEIKAEKSISAHQVGSDQGIKTCLLLYDKNKLLIEEKIKELNALETKLAAEIGPIERQLKSKAAILKKSGENISDRQREELKKWAEAYNSINQKLKYVKLKNEELLHVLKKPKVYDGFIKVPGTIYNGVEINIYGINVPVTAIMVNKRFRLLNNVVESEDKS